MLYDKANGAMLGGSGKGGWATWEGTCWRLGTVKAVHESNEAVWGGLRKAGGGTGAWDGAGGCAAAGAVLRACFAGPFLRPM